MSSVRRYEDYSARDLKKMIAERRKLADLRRRQGETFLFANDHGHIDDMLEELEIRGEL
ncbi:hypothetical protein [Streptomyces sp. SID3343]|uniref:hypothetical protein n=1 Tax=Streptomyces sp. SID3343 TaxID=2690260 RepID=UPI00136CF4E2|nr:hypothetical protein [Streptomyces sp. SID3343]MYW01447.1 hypothetical protein [Streptomyces sp. SID3343]